MTWLKLVRTSEPADARESVLWPVGDRVGGGEELVAGVDLGCAVAAGGLYEPADRPAGAVFEVSGGGERGEDGGQVCLDGGPFVR